MKQPIVRGLDDVQETLSRLATVEDEESLETGLARGGAKAIVRAKQLVPVDSGDLRDNLHVGGYTNLTPGYRAVGIYGSLGKPKGRWRGRAVLAGTKLPYAQRVERGTKRTRAKPFLRPAVDGSERVIAQEVDKAIQGIIDD
jgi:HK97 gp10 family phage protein